MGVASVTPFSLAEFHVSSVADSVVSSFPLMGHPHHVAHQGLLVALWAVLACVPAMAQNRPVYRCPGPPVSYTDALTPDEAQRQACRTLDGQAITITQPRRPELAPAESGSTVPNSPRASTATPRADTRIEPRVAMRIDPAVQRSRDADARRILQEELKREEDGLNGLVSTYRQGQPDKRPEDANPQVYQQRVADLKAAIDRKQSDIAAIRRELSKVAP
jgi:hypothetical protein